jgi:hypothetical protein
VASIPGPNNVVTQSEHARLLPIGSRGKLSSRIPSKGGFAHRRCRLTATCLPPCCGPGLWAFRNRQSPKSQSAGLPVPQPRRIRIRLRSQLITKRRMARLQHVNTFRLLWQAFGHRSRHVARRSYKWLLVIGRMTEGSWLRGQDRSSPSLNLIGSVYRTEIGLPEASFRDQMGTCRFLNFTPDGYPNTWASAMVRPWWCWKNMLQNQRGRTL